MAKSARLHVRVNPQLKEWLDGYVDARCARGLPTTRTTVLEELLADLREREQRKAIQDAEQL